MKLIAACAIAAAFTAFSLPPALASENGPAKWSSQQSLSDAVGQPVYDLGNGYVGTIRSVVEDRGTEVALIAKGGSSHGLSHGVVASAEDLGPRADGGMLLALSAGSVAELRPYTRGEPLPIVP